MVTPPHLSLCSSSEKSGNVDVQSASATHERQNGRTRGEGSVGALAEQEEKSAEKAESFVEKEREKGSPTTSFEIK